MERRSRSARTPQSAGAPSPERQASADGTPPPAEANGKPAHRQTGQPSRTGVGLRLAMGFLLRTVWCYRQLDTVLAWTGAELRDAATLGSAKNGEASAEPDATVGPILPRPDAPRLFSLLTEIARRTGGVFPTEVRVAYLPACGVLDLGDENGYPRRVLIIGLPCLQIWSVEELGAVLAHEIAHWRNQDAQFAREVVQFGMELHELTRSPARWLYHLHPRWLLARAMGIAVIALAAPISRAMEFRADQVAAECFGGPTLATALEKLAIVQPIFREILLLHDPLTHAAANVFDRFQTAWSRLPQEKLARWRRRLVEGSCRTSSSDPHPPLKERLTRLGTCRNGPAEPASSTVDNALNLLENPAALRMVLHNRLYGAYAEPESVFQRS